MCKCKCNCNSENRKCPCGFLKSPKGTVCLMSLIAAALYTLGSVLTERSNNPSALIKRFFVTTAGFMVGQFIAALLIPANSNNNTEE